MYEPDWLDWKDAQAVAQLAILVEVSRDAIVLVYWRGVMKGMDHLACPLYLVIPGDEHQDTYKWALNTQYCLFRAVAVDGVIVGYTPNPNEEWDRIKRTYLGD